MAAISGARPATFPGFDVVSELGRGAETVVYRVHRDGREYALKLLTAAGANNSHALAAVRREAALLASVGHPLLPRIVDVGQIDVGPYLVLEYIAGSPLSEIVRDGAVDETMAVRIVRDVVGPLAAAHRAGLVHRDVKPDNIIVGTDGTARLIDFGLAARGGNQGGRVAGTLLYSAPEQTGMLKRPVDGRSDLYALGVVLFECVTGRTPFQSLDAGELIRQHATAPVPDPRALRPGLSPTLANVIGKLLAKDPDDRYQTGESLLADLDQLTARPGAVFDIGRGAQDAPRSPSNVLVGRAREVVDLASRWLDAREGRGGCALVQGPSGVGKTRLVRELTNAVATDGDLLLYGKCQPDDPVPLAPLRHAVERYLRSVDELPAPEREVAVERLRRAAGRGGPLLRALSPMLAVLVQAPDLGAKDRHEQFTNAVAAFLVDLAEECGGAVLHVDDVQWLDGPTRRVLHQVSTRLTNAPLLVIATGRDDGHNTAALDRFADDMGATLDTRIPLAPLDEDAVADLINLHLGGVHVAHELTDELVARIGGNPFTVVEFVRAVIDAGLITPSWGQWRLDLAGVDRLDLTGDAQELVLQRIAQLGPEGRRLLAAAAATGRRFPAALVASVCTVDPKFAANTFAEAESRRLITGAGPGSYRFLHDRIREALLGQLDAPTRRQLHQRIAEVLEREAPDLPQWVYAIAQHYARGETARTPDKVYTSGLAAGRLALADHAPAEAMAFLETAGAAARAAGVSPTADFHVALGVSCARTGRFAEALEHLDRGLDAEPDALRRAATHIEIAQVHLGAWDPGRAFATVRRGLAELGRPLPKGRFTLLVSTLTSFVVGLTIGATKIGFGNAVGRDRERFRLQSMFYDIGGYASTMRMNVKMRAVMAFRSLYAINRLGPGTQYSRHMAGFGIVASLMRKDKLAERIFDRAATAAADRGDPVLVAHVEFRRGAGLFISGADDGQAWVRTITEHERWLELGDYLTGVSGECVRLLQCGATREAQRWFARGQARLGAGAEAEGAGFGAVAAALPAQFGRPEDATAGLDALRRYLTLNPDNRTQVVNLFSARILTLVEKGELGLPFEQVVTEFTQLGMAPKDMLPMQRVFFIYQAYGRLAQCHRAPVDQRDELIRTAEHAVEQLEASATIRILRAHHFVARADLAVLKGHPADAMHDLVSAELEIVTLDAPLIAFEAARVRARAQWTLGQTDAAESQARFALAVAIEQQWPHRINWVRQEFELADPPAPPPPVPVPVAPAPQPAVGDSNDALNRRRLAALQQVSLAAATILDPRELARVALDETVRILGAERAYLFLVDTDLGQLVPHLGRDLHGNDIDILTGYGSTLVDRVRRTGTPIVVTGSEEGEALGSVSAQVHGLRSIMIAPLLYEGRLLGIVYLDSRVAKGMFTKSDVGILTAITNHVAISLVTARAAQLAVAVQATRRQRDVAETLRAAMKEQTETLDPGEVMHRLLESLTRTLDGDAAVLLAWVGEHLVVTASHGGAAPAGTRMDPVPPQLLDLGLPRAGTVPDGEFAPFLPVLGALRSWLAIPVTGRGEPLGILLIASAKIDAMQEEQVELAAALAGQGMTAYDNARLFSEVQRLATIDGLTALFNRAYFFAEATKLARIAQRYARPFAAIMMDVDHFKIINDTYGHPVGDEVIRIVAARLRATARDSDLLGRYGGEEFALVTPETGGSATLLAERIRTVIAAEPVMTAAGPLAVTISVGVASVDSGEQDLGQVLARADAALYEAKQSGRNRVVADSAELA